MNDAGPLSVDAPFECYVYWKLDAGSVEAAAVALAAFQQQLRERHPGLQARLLCKQVDGSAEATLMETYALPGGLSPELAKAVVDEGGRVAVAWCRGSRHIERFQVLGL